MVRPAKVGQSAGATVVAKNSATATSYSAMSANALAANARRCARVNPPPEIASRTIGYAAGEVTTATEAWFFAAARTIAGPPMSICSMDSSTDAPDATVSWNGYRLDTSSSNGATPRSVSCSRCAGRRVSASRPACTRGCSVLTRPSSTSGKPVRSSTLVTGTPAAAIAAAVEPVDTISTPPACRAVASSISPVLSYTLTRARRSGRRASSFMGS